MINLNSVRCLHLLTKTMENSGEVVGDALASVGVGVQ